MSASIIWCAPTKPHSCLQCQIGEGTLSLSPHRPMLSVERSASQILSLQPTCGRRQELSNSGQCGLVVPLLLGFSREPAERKSPSCSGCSRYPHSHDPFQLNQRFQ
jgi:hypothetical protein